MEQSLFLPAELDFILSHFHYTSSEIKLSVISSQLSSQCPICQCISIKVRTQAVEALSSRYPLLGMSLMCSWFGFSRQAWYVAIKQMEKNVFEFDLVIGEIKRIRKRILGIGSGICMSL